MAKTWFVNTNKFPFVLVTRGYDKGYRVQCLGYQPLLFYASSVLG